ncbi:peroxidase mlt-7-like [Branchiostoma floridae]|uniref:Peroxidase mlt-7-like n=1 Tax=Branchiostoma floridae TaxID=7739 RepID=A0A9J7HEH4_BRAFL|nr:peroxidase mlt-7-like [Branchiostoma floridae]
MHVSLLTVLLAMVVMVIGHVPTEEQLQEAVAMATKELDNAHCVRTDNKVFCEEEPKQAKVVPVTHSESPCDMTATRRSTPKTIKLSRSAAILEKVAKNLMNSPEHFTLEQLSKVESPIINKLCVSIDCEELQHMEDGKEFRTADGCGNNEDKSWWGSTQQCMKRLLEPQYGNDNAPRTTGLDGKSLPKARHVSRVMHEDLRKSNHETSLMLMQFGQFTSHEITMSPVSDATCSCGSSDPQCFNIEIPHGDPDFRGRTCLKFTRSVPCPKVENDGGCMGPRQQFDQITSFLDASNVYGLTKKDMDDLRHGFLLTPRSNSGNSKKELLPEAVDNDKFAMSCEGFTDDVHKCSRAGDIRANENPGLTSLHTLFMREHNRIARKLNTLNSPKWGPDRVFFEARKIVGALFQKIAYGDYLPLVLGPDFMTKFVLTLTQPDKYFQGYDKTVNPGIYNAFNTAANRFGHSMVQNEFDRYSKGFPDARLNSQHPINLAFSFFNPSYILDDDQGGPDSILRGLITAQSRQDFDRFIVSGLTKHLFECPKIPNISFDLAAINIQRGRDHGLPGYNAFREKCGLHRAPRFDDLSPEIPDATTREKLQTLYRDVDDIDLFVGGLAEKSVPGGIVGPTFAYLIGMQFHDIRKGDRFWFENPGQFSEDQLKEIKKHSLASILCDNTDTTDIQPNVFLQHTQPGNDRVKCTEILPKMDLSLWKE